MPLPKDYPFPWLSAKIVNAFFPYLKRGYIYGSWFLDAVFVRWLRAAYAPKLTDASKSIVSGRIASVNIGHNVPKPAVQSAFVTKWGLVGDTQRGQYIAWHGGHGGFDKAVMLWSEEVINEVNAEGHKCFPGSSGEQLTLSGIDWSLMKTGVRLEIGTSLLLEITYLKAPCLQQIPYFAEKDKNGNKGHLRISPKRYPDSSRIHTRVLRTGVVKVGDVVRVFQHPDGAQPLKMIDIT